MFFKRKKAKNNTNDDARNTENPDAAVADSGRDAAFPGADENGLNKNGADPGREDHTDREDSSGRAPDANIRTETPDARRAPETAAPASGSTRTAFSRATPDEEREGAVRPGHEAPREAASDAPKGRGSVVITFSAIIMVLALLALFTAFMPQRPLWLTQEPQIMATAEAGFWLPGKPAITPYPLFNWLVAAVERLTLGTLELAPRAALQITAYICMAVFLLSALSLSKATGQPRKIGMASALLLFAMGPVAGLAWFARPEPLFAGLVTLSFGYFFWAARHQKSFVFMTLAALAAVLALFCGGLWGAILPVIGLILFCLLGLRPKRLLVIDVAIAVGLIIAVPLIFGAGLMLFADKGAAEAFFSALGRAFPRVFTHPAGLSALWRAPLILVCVSLPWILSVFFLSPRRVKSWISTLPLWLMFLCLAVWGGARVSGDPTRDMLVLLPALPPLAVILARWIMLLAEPRIGIFTRLAGLVLFLAGLAAVIATVVHVADLTSIESLLPLRIPDFMPFWAVLVPGIVAVIAGAAVWSAARRVTDLKAVAAIAAAILVTGQAAGQFFLPQLAPRFTFSVIGPAIQAYARDGVPTIAMDMPVNSLYAWSRDVVYLDELNQIPTDLTSYALVMPLDSWKKDAVSLSRANAVTQTVGRVSYMLVPVLSGPLPESRRPGDAGFKGDPGDMPDNASDSASPDGSTTDNKPGNANNNADRAEPNDAPGDPALVPDQNETPESESAATPKNGTSSEPGNAPEAAPNDAPGSLDESADKPALIDTSAPDAAASSGSGNAAPKAKAPDNAANQPPNGDANAPVPPGPTPGNTENEAFL